MTGEFVARPAPGRILLLLAGSLAFVLLGLWMVGAFGAAPDQDAASLIGWISILFFGACSAAIAHRLFDPRDQIVVSHRGIYWRRWSPEMIPWQEIAGMEVRSMNRQRFLCIHLRDPGRHRSTTLMGRLAGMNRSMGFGDIAISTIGTDKSLDELCAAIDRFGPPAEPARVRA